MMDQTSIGNHLKEMKQIAPAGFAIACHVSFSSPTFLFQTYPKAWSDHYSANGLVMSDPTVAWSFANTGTRRWSEMVQDDSAGVLAAAADYGLTHGVTVSVDDNDSRTMASFARENADFDDASIKRLYELVAEVHQVTGEIRELSPETTQILRKMSVHIGPA